jgi:hypothetical protein
MNFNTARLKSDFYHCSDHRDDRLLDAGLLSGYFCNALRWYVIALVIVSLLVAHDPSYSVAEYFSTPLKHSFCFVRNSLHQCSGFTLGPSSDHYHSPGALLVCCIHHSCKSRNLWYDPYSHNCHTFFQHLILSGCFSVYDFLDPQKQGALLAVYMAGIVVGQAIVFILVRYVIVLREHLVGGKSERNAAVELYVKVEQNDIGNSKA